MTDPDFEPSGPLHDPGRLDALRRTALLDTPAEEAFDRLARLAAALCKTPIALVSLVDEHRQFFKSAIGLPEPLASRRETPLTGSYCKHVVATGEPLVIEDAREDVRALGNPSLKELDAVAYLGIPLRTAQGYILGSLCVIDTRRRAWTAMDIALLGDLAVSVMSEIALRTTLREQERMQQALRESEGRFRTMADGLPLMVWVHGPGGEQEFVNRTFCEFFGVTPEEMHGERWRELVHPDDLDGYVEKFWNCLQERRPFNAEVRVRSAGGEWRWIESRARPRFSGSGEFLGYVGASADITARKEAEERLRQSEARYRDLVQNANSAIIRWTRDGCLTFFNEYAERLFGYRAPEVIGKHVGLLIPERDSTGKDLSALIDDIVAHPHEHADNVNENVARDGRRIWMLWTNRPVFDDHGNVVEMLAVGSDITKLKAIEAQLQEADRRKDEFLATLAHELRNPLAPVHSGIDLLRLSRGDQTITERTLGMMERQMTHLVRLVDDLLDVSRITRGKVELLKERINLSEAIRSAAESVDLSEGALQREVSITLPAERLLVDADPVRLVQVITNLLNNAAKYTERNGRIWITAARDGERACVSVRDDGRGIAPDMLEHVFEMFHQGDPGGGGLGIGLTLVRSLVELHGGGIEARSDGPGRGSEFILRLPLAGREPRPAATRQDNDEASISGHRVLVVDDNQDAAASLGMLLEILGAEVRVVHDGGSALATLDAFQPHEVLLDVGMPEIDGCEVARRIRARDQDTGPRLIAVTGWGQAEDRKRVKDAGFDHHLVKPVGLEDLRRAFST